MSDKKKITRVRIEHDDGTYLQLTDPAGCERWKDMADGPAVMAFAHGMSFNPLPWEEGKIVGTTDFLAGVESAAGLVEAHCCVSTCCDAQPGASEAQELARCIRKNLGVGVCEHEKEHWQQIEERGELSLRCFATWCKQCGSLNDGTWKAPTGFRRAKP